MTPSTAVSSVRSAAAQPAGPSGGPDALRERIGVGRGPRHDEDRAPSAASCAAPAAAIPRRARHEADPVGEAAGHRATAATVATSRRRSSGVARAIAEPTPTATAPASRNAAAFVASIPPVTIVSISGIGPCISRTCAGPSEEPGKSFTNVAPARHARSASVGV